MISNYHTASNYKEDDSAAANGPTVYTLAGFDDNRTSAKQPQQRQQRRGLFGRSRKVATANANFSKQHVLGGDMSTADSASALSSMAYSYSSNDSVQSAGESTEGDWNEEDKKRLLAKKINPSLRQGVSTTSIATSNYSTTSSLNYSTDEESWLDGARIIKKIEGNNLDGLLGTMSSGQNSFEHESQDFDDNNAILGTGYYNYRSGSSNNENTIKEQRFPSRNYHESRPTPVSTENPQQPTTSASTFFIVDKNPSRESPSLGVGSHRSYLKNSNKRSSTKKPSIYAKVGARDDETRNFWKSCGSFDQNQSKSSYHDSKNTLEQVLLSLGIQTEVTRLYIKPFLCGIFD